MISPLNLVSPALYRRASRHAWTRVGLATAMLGALVGGGCKYDLPIDDAKGNPGVPGPVGVIQGTASYYGPGPCVRNGLIEGALIILAFDYSNPPPPAGLATTALNLATVPAELLFQGMSRPTDPKVPGGGPVEFCPSLDSAPITAAAQFTVTQLPAGRYQLRAFFSRQNKFFPLFDYSNLPMAGDAVGGAVVDPRSDSPRFIQIDVGVPVDPANPTGQLKIPDSGFLVGGIPIVVGQTLKTSRPYFHVDYAGSRGFANPKGDKKDVHSAWPYDDTVAGDKDGLEFPQDHPITSQQKLECLGGADPKCSVLEFAEASLPSVHFRYGFPGTASDPKVPDLFGVVSADAWIALNARPDSAFGSNARMPYYGLDPLAFELTPSSPLPDEARKFVLTRNFFPDGSPAVLVDNKDLETLGKIADLFPAVVLAKLQDDDSGNLVVPPTPQTDPIVVIQGFTLRKNSMRETSQSDLINVADADIGLTEDSKHAPRKPLNTRGGQELYDDFTALIRPAAVCVSPHDPQLRGSLVVPFEQDPNPANPGAFLVSRERILEVNAARVKAIEFGCLPPGYYSINVVQPTGQAWSLPNLTGTCSFSVRGAPVEECMRAPDDVTAFLTKGFPKRPYVTSQMLYATDSTGANVLGSDGKPKPLVVHVTPSARCMDIQAGPGGSTVLVNHAKNEDLNHDGTLDPGEDTNDNKILDLNVPDICLALKAPGAACIANTQCITKQCTAGVCKQKNVGDPCARDAECGSFSCDGTSSLCVKGRTGVPCTAGDQCASGKCTASACQ